MNQLHTDHRLICSWSGGKDSCYALMKSVEAGNSPVVLFNVLNESGQRSRSHGLTTDFLKAQADAMSLPIEFISSSWNEYEQKFIASLQQLAVQYDLDDAVYGDIDIQSHRDWEEKVSKAAGLDPVLPLWQKDRLELVEDMIDSRIRAIIVSCRNELSQLLLGRIIDSDMLNEFHSLGIDPCGENGEYHTAVIDCPMFNEPIPYELGERKEHEHYSFIDLMLKR